VLQVPVEDFVFGIAALVGGVLLLINILLDDVLGGVFEAIGIGFDIGGTSITPLLLAFVAMFGAGGLFATQALDVHGAQAAGVGAAFGIAGAAIAGLLFTVLRRSESPEPFSRDDLVGQTAFVTVAIPGGRQGSVLVRAEGQTHEFGATAGSDIPAGTTVRIVGVAGAGLIVALEEASQTTQPTA
jgi:membrane protein implicated in regulation of membrane protease activity